MGNERGRVVRYKFAFQWCESQVCSTFDISHRLRMLKSNRESHGGQSLPMPLSINVSEKIVYLRLLRKI